MPPWAPERLRELSPSERGAEMRRLRGCEEDGRAERVRRRERVREMREVGERVEKRYGRVMERDLSDGDCGRCEELEGRVQGLEEMLGVLRGVLEEGGEEKKAGWLEYFGRGGGQEKGRLRKEVEALQKATDFLVEKLEKPNLNERGKGKEDSETAR